MKKKERMKGGLNYLPEEILTSGINIKGMSKLKNWIFLKNYKNSISNLKLNINLYYKFSKKIPRTFNWYSLKENKEFIPSFTKRIFRQVSTLF